MSDLYNLIILPEAQQDIIYTWHDQTKQMTDRRMEEL